jgi:4-hydroxy-3-methylbut-2-enyl diphosphate reductase IspH
MQYSAKSQSTPRCQSLITAKSDHPSVLGRSGPQSPQMSALTTRTSNQFKEKRKRKEMKEKLKQVIKSQTKAKKRSLERSWSPRARATTRHNRDKMLQICRLLKVRQKGSTPSTKEHN